MRKSCGDIDTTPLEKNFDNSDKKERQKFNSDLSPVKKDFDSSNKQKR